MTTLTLTLRDGVLAQRIDLSGVTPERLAAMTQAAIERIKLSCGNLTIPLGELFEVTGTPGAILAFVGTTARCDFIGAGMTEGAIRVDGDVGASAAEGMRGGGLIVKGNAGPYAARGMVNGLLGIWGNAGDFFASSHPGTRRGMAGGVARVDGNVGDRAGEFLRRGIVLVGGDAGDYCGARATAGTIVVLGRAGAMAGWSLQRASLVLARMPESMPPTFGDAGVHDILYLRLLARELERQEWSPFAGRAQGFARVRRFAGDSQVGGRGEILVAAP